MAANRMIRGGALAAGLALVAAACAGDDGRSGAAAAEAATVQAAVASGTGAAPDGAVPVSDVVKVYKSPTCGCCSDWVDHLRENGFEVEAVDTTDMNAIKTRYGVGQHVSSCHTALVGGYVVEGHVPAEDIRRLLAERPDVVGIAAPGMPLGSPGMEGPVKQEYDVVAFRKDGSTTVFARH